MESATKNGGAGAATMTTPTKDHRRSKNQEPFKFAENLNPNNNQTPIPKSCSNSSSPAVKKSCSISKSQKKSAPSPTTTTTSTKSNNNPQIANSPQNKIRQRKFVVAKKKKNAKNSEKTEEEGGSNHDGSKALICKCKEENKKNKCLCVAYQNLRKSQEEFFTKRQQEQQQDDDRANEIECVIQKEEEKEEELNELGANVVDLAVKRRRERRIEELRENVPQGGGSGKVMNLVKAFERLLSIPDAEKEQEQDQDQVEKETSQEVVEEEEKKTKTKKVLMKWLLPGFPLPDATTEGVVSGGSSFCPPQCVLTSENLGLLDRKASVSSSWDSSRGSVSSRTSNGRRRSRRNSLESTSTFGGSRWKKKQVKVTHQKPFKLRTEERGKLKEEEFVKKVQEMMTEEEKQRIPIAQGLPWTTDEPECLVKPPVKETTRPIDLKLHSDVRAIDRAEFDHQVAEKLSFIEQYKLERDRQQKLAEEEELRRLRKELVPKAQPMPYFDRPFIPKRSTKDPTIPREPKFHAPQHKRTKCSLSSWNDMSPYSSLS